jgi:class 3 adenylate cyclase
MSIPEKQVDKGIIDIIDGELELSRQPISITNRNLIPDTSEIPIENQTTWFKIPDIICVFADMIGSTRLSAENHEKTTAKAYRLFTSSLIRIFDYYESPYIDIKGDGVFALFNSNQVYRALVAAVTVKTMIENEICPRIKNLTELDIGAHMGMDQKTILVRKLGLKRYKERTDRQNEVWAGKTVNMAAKLASMSVAGELIVSDRYFANIDNDLARKSCGCQHGKPTLEKVDLWSEIDTKNDSKFDFEKAYKLKSIWCENHGSEYISKLLALDE